MHACCRFRPVYLHDMNISSCRYFDEAYQEAKQVLILQHDVW